MARVNKTLCLGFFSSLLKEALGERFAEVLEQASDGGNSRRFVGVTGRAAAKAGKVGRSSRPAAYEEAPESTANALPTARPAKSAPSINKNSVVPRTGFEPVLQP